MSDEAALFFLFLLIKKQDNIPFGRERQDEGVYEGVWLHEGVRHQGRIIFFRHIQTMVRSSINYDHTNRFTSI